MLLFLLLPAFWAAIAVIVVVARSAICFVFIQWLRSIFSIFIACKLKLHRPYTIYHHKYMCAYILYIDVARSLPLPLSLSQSLIQHSYLCQLFIYIYVETRKSAHIHAHTVCRNKELAKAPNGPGVLWSREKEPQRGECQSRQLHQIEKDVWEFYRIISSMYL